MKNIETQKNFVKYILQFRIQIHSICFLLGYF